MIVITDEYIKDLARRIREGEDVLEELKKVYEIKETLLWRAETATCACVMNSDLPTRFCYEVSYLEDAIKALEKGDRDKAAQLLLKVKGEET